MNNDYNDDMIDVLCGLMQLDYDAVKAYEQALDEISEDDIHRRIESFRQDHLRHIDDLSALIKKLGGTPPERSSDLKGFFIEGFTALRSLTGTKGALSAMESNEKTTNKNYKQAIDESDGTYPEEVMFLLQKNYSDEQRHLQYIQAALKKMSNIVAS